MFRPNSLAGAGGRVGGHQVRLLRIYLGATTFLYSYGVVFTIFPVRTDIAYANPAGGIVAIVLGAAALAQLAVWPRRLTFATAAAMLATPVVMAFHVTLTAEYMCLISPMFLAMYLRAFHRPGRAWLMIGCLTVACVVAVVMAPAPHVGVITVLIIIVAIIGAAESFGLLMRALFADSCSDPMTGLLNRAGWEMASAELVTRARATRAPVTVVALDIDGLKRLNDTYGHDAGDRRILDYARTWRRALPRGAALARLGGDEFAVCLIGDKPEIVADFLGVLRSQTPDASVGTATSAELGIADLYAQADAELYRSRGRPLTRRTDHDVVPNSGFPESR